MDGTHSQEKHIRKLIDDLCDALDRKDANAVVSYFTRDCVDFSLAPPLVSEDSGSEGLNAWFDTWKGPMRNESRDLTVAVSGDVAYAHSISRMRGTKVDGEQVDLWFRQTLGLRKVGDAWKIAHQHASVPFYMDGSYKAAIDLKP